LALRDALREAIDQAEADFTPLTIVAPPAPEAPPFTDLEERVIDLARQEGIGAIEPPGRFERLLAVLFGVRPGGQPLADPKLEALRRATIVAHHRHHLPDTHAAELREAGYTPDQVRALETRAIGG